MTFSSRIGRARMSWSPNKGSLDLDTLHGLYQSGELRPTGLVDAIYRRLETCKIDHIWIHVLPKEEVLAQAAHLERLDAPARRALPLYGIPYAVKDNIDVAGQPTTAACPAFRYVPDDSATVVKKLNEAGALLIGKTNLDQFATGLVGTRSPYGACPNPFDARYIAGGSSSGSAVAVAAGLVSFALGTDTAGSGRVPAGFTNIVGLKPTRGLLSTSGVVPACRSLDCVSILALTCEDALTILEAGQGPDPADPFSRARPDGAGAATSGSLPRGFRFGVPRPDQLVFFGNTEYERLYVEALAALANLGGQRVEIDFTPFLKTAALLYEGPWVAERLSVVKGLLADQPEALLPVTRQIIEGGRCYSAVDAYEGYYRLKAYQKLAAPVWQQIDLMVVPTTGTIYTIDKINAEPFALNTNLGYYTNFVNLLDLCAWAVPNKFQPNGLPMGVTLIAPAFQEESLGRIAAAFHRHRNETMGATGCSLKETI